MKKDNVQKSNRNSRDSRFELLKIICMLAIVSYHMINQSGIAVFDTVAEQIFFFTMHNGGRMACTILFMITSYFLVDTEFKIERLYRICHVQCFII